MRLLCISFTFVIGCSFIVSTRTEHHEIPIISNNSAINNTFTITSFINFTSLLNIDDEKDLDSEESYDDAAALMDDYITEEESSLDDDGHHKNATVSDSSDQQEDEDDADFKFLTTRARWSYAPGFVERMCRGECQATGKPFGRLLGAQCQCYCPLNAPTLGLCDTNRACDQYCSSIGYSRGGDCVYNNVCFCFCKKSAPYDVSRVYTK